MNRQCKRHLHQLMCAVAIGLVTAASRGWAQFRETVSPQAFGETSLFIPRLRYLETDIEAEQDSYHSSAAGPTSSTHLYASPRLGVEWKNYVYHPYLLTYSLLFEPGYVWERRTFGSEKTQSDEFTLNGNYTANFLEVKPYATTLNYNRSHEEVKYDFFNTATVDSQGFGATTGYREGPVPVTLSFNQNHEDSTDFNQRTVSDQRNINLEAKNAREKDNVTDLTYQFNQFDRETMLQNAQFRSENTYHHLGLIDTEHFSSSTLQSTFHFNDRESTGNSSSDLNAGANYNVHHSDSLRSYYNLSASRFDTDESDSTQTYAQAGLQHQLYESLATGVELHGSTFNSSAGASSLDSQSVGTSVSLNYTKRLTSWARLTLDNSAGYSFTEQQTSGSELVIANESYTVPPNGLVRLTQPREVAIALVTDANNTPLQPGLDYIVIQTTDPWQIQVLTTGPARVQPGSIIFVTYTVRTNPSGHYSIISGQSQIRVSLWDNLAAVYLRYYLADNHASAPGFLLQDDQVLETGAELNWHQLHLTGSYINEHSTLFDSRSYNLAESYTYDISSDCSLGADFTQQWSDNSFRTDTGGTQLAHMTYYNFMLHYNWHPLQSLNWTAEIGYRLQRGFGLDEDLFAARTYVNWNIGKFQLHFGYEHELQDIRPTSRDRDFIFLRARRSF